MIDKFSRTKGSQLTGIKAWNSIVIRIGNNYTPTARHYYVDSNKKCVMSVGQDVRIKLHRSTTL